MDQQIANEDWEHYRMLLLRFIGSRISDQQAAEDVLQSVLLKALERWHTLKQPDKRLPWLYQIARHTVIDYYRGARQDVPLPDELLAEQLSEDWSTDMACDVSDALEQIPEKYRQPLRLYEMEGVPQTEIAKRLGLSFSGAKSRVQRGRQMLKQAVLDCCFVERDRLGNPIRFVPRHPEGCYCGCVV